MHASEVTDEVVDRANELYWGSDRSVNQIADDLELSKGALYGIIEPEPSGMGCPLCGDEVVYSNRTAKEKEMLDCPTCDWDGAPDETTAYHDSAQRSATEATGRDVPSRASGGPKAGAEPDDELLAPDEVPPPPPSRTPTSTVVGGALVGAAVGLALVMWARRK